MPISIKELDAREASLPSNRSLEERIPESLRARPNDALTEGEIYGSIHRDRAKRGGLKGLVDGMLDKALDPRQMPDYPEFGAALAGLVDAGKVRRRALGSVTYFHLPS